MIAVTDGKTVLATFAVEREAVVRFGLPNGAQLSPVTVGWKDETYSVLPVTPFELPEGQRTIGGPSYVVGKDSVQEVFETEAIPAADPADYPLNGWRFHWMIGKLGWDAAIRAAIGSIANDDARTITLARYEKSHEYNRDDAALNQIAALMGLSLQDLDTAWMTAATVAA